VELALAATAGARVPESQRGGFRLSQAPRPVVVVGDVNALWLAFGVDGIFEADGETVAVVNAEDDTSVRHVYLRVLVRVAIGVRLLVPHGHAATFGLRDRQALKVSWRALVDHTARHPCPTSAIVVANSPTDLHQL